MLEKAVEEIVRRFPREVFPDLELTFVEGQRRLAGGNIIDLRFRDASGIHWVLELKRSRITVSAIEQLGRYLDQLRATEPQTQIEGIVVGFSIAEAATNVAARRKVRYRILTDSALRRIAERHAIPVDHDSGYRPRLRRTNRDQSIVRARSKARPATTPEVVAFLRALDAQFPPGSLDGTASRDEVRAYWQIACPHAPLFHQEIAAELSLAVLSRAEGTAIAARSQSLTDPYTTIRAGDGRVAAAIDARAGYVKLDFPLPIDVAEESKRRGLLTIWNPRGYSVWVQSRVGRAMPLDEAKRLLALGLEWEFKGAGR